MWKPKIDNLKLWYIAAGSQYILLAILALVASLFEHFSRREIDYGILFLGAGFFVLVSLFAFVCSLSEKSVIGVLIVAAPFYLPFLIGQF
jgi:hypothetical protein